MTTIGIIADTHGLLRPEAIAAFAGVDHVVHAGDVGSPDVLATLAEIAPVTAVRGNNDHGPWAAALPLTNVLELPSALLYVVHELDMLDLDPKAAGIRAVITGHSHRPVAEMRSDVLYLNPGSAGPRRFSLPVSAARLRITNDRLDHELIDLTAGAGRTSS